MEIRHPMGLRHPVHIHVHIYMYLHLNICVCACVNTGRGVGGWLSVTYEPYGLCLNWHSANNEEGGGGEVGVRHRKEGGGAENSGKELQGELEGLGEGGVGGPNTPQRLLPNWAGMAIDSRDWGVASVLQVFFFPNVRLVCDMIFPCLLTRLGSCSGVEGFFSPRCATHVCRNFFMFTHEIGELLLCRIFFPSSNMCEITDSDVRHM